MDAGWQGLAGTGLPMSDNETNAVKTLNIERIMKVKRRLAAGGCQGTPPASAGQTIA